MRIMVYVHGQMVAMREAVICATMGGARRMITMGMAHRTVLKKLNTGVARRVITVANNHGRGPYIDNRGG